MPKISKIWLLAAAALAPLAAQAQTTCSTASLNGAYFYVLTGNYFRSDVGFFVPYAESGKFVADGNGGITGQATLSLVGNNITSGSLSGSYAVQANCTGNMILNTAAYSLQILDGGQTVFIAPSSANYGVAGQAFRAANATGGQCGNGSLIGTYSYQQTGGFLADSQGDIGYYSEIGQLSGDGNGNITTTNIYNVGSGGTAETGTGTYAINSDCSGTMQITYPGATSAFNYNIGLAQGNNLVIMENDAENAIGGNGQRPSIGSILPQFVFGGGVWYSALYFTNTNSTSVSFTVNFTADGGAPLSVPLLGVSGSVTSYTVTLAPNGTAVLEAPNSGTFAEGYAAFTLPPGVSGYGIFRQSIAGRPDQEAVVPLSSATSTTSTLAFDETSGAVDSMAIANPSAVAANVTITVWDTTGTLLGTSQPIAISPNSKTVGTLDTLSGVTLTGKRGSAQFTVSTGNVAVLGLRFVGVALTSIPSAGN